MGQDSWALCDGPGPVPLRRVINLRNGYWLIDGDHVEHSSLKSAAAAESYLVAELKSSVVEKDGEVRTVITYDNVLERLKSEGWTTVGETLQF